MFYNLMFIYNTVFCRLIVSNTLTIPNSIPIHDQTISLTVWFLFRYQIISQNQKPMPLLYITNQDKEVEVKAEFDLFTNGLSLLLNLQDQAQYNIYGNDYYDGWHKLQINRDGCFNRLEYEDIILHQNCSKQNDAILDICFFQCFNLYVYDTDELINEEIIISYSILKTEFVFINTDKNYLVLKFYLKFYTNIQEKTTFFALQSNTGPSLVFSSQQNIIYISLFKNSQSQEYEVVHQINILQDQWFLFSIAFNQKELLMYYYINNQINQLKILQINSLHIGTKFEIRNTEAIIVDSLQIISQLTEKFVGSCISVCQFCLSGQCYDEIKHKSLEFNISRALRDSIYFNECYFNQNQYCGDQFYLKDGSCQERQFIVSNNRPKYRGEYCIDCNISRQSIDFLKNRSKFSIIAKTIDFTFYLKTQPSKQEYEEQQNNGLIFQDDLNIYLMKSKDIYLSYHLTGMSFCEEGYQSFEHKCIKYKKAIMQIIFDLPICKQKYHFHNKNCIICQQHCLYCKLERKSLRCILFADDYFQNDKNMIKKCNKESKINNCLTQKEAIENLEIRGYQVCQNNQMYLVEFSRCEDIAQIYSQYIYLIHFPDIIQIQNQKLELQYQLEDYKNMVQDKQIRYLIYMQQLKKINKQINYYTKKQQIIRRDLLFQQLSNHNSTFEEISNKKIILQNITILLDEHITIIFKNRVYFNINQIFEQVEDYYQMIQFDLTFDFFNVQSNQIYSFMIDFEDFKNKTFIYNVRFTKIFAVLVMNTNRFIFKCNQIIFNNLTLDNDDRIDIFYNDSPLFLIYSNEIIINNLIVMNKRLGNLFSILDFKSLKIQNVQIIDSFIDILIRSSYCQYNSIIEIEEIYVTRSVLTRLIQIQASRIQIKNIHYYGVIMESYNFYINYCQNVYLYNFYLNEVYFNQSYLLQKKDDGHDIYSKIYQYTCILQNIHIKGGRTLNSTFFQLMHMQNIEFKQLFINSLEFYNTQVIQINLVHNLSIQYFILKECYLFNESIILDVVSIDTIKLKNLYLHSLDLRDCGNAIYIQSDRILIQFILLDLFSLYDSNLLLFNAEKINSIKNLIFKVSNVTKSEQFLIKFFSKCFLSIENVYFIKHQLIDSHFIKIQSGLQIFIKNLQFIDFFIMNNILESLILIDIGKQRNIIQLFVIKAFNIQNFFQLYYLVKLNNPQKMIIYNFQLENVNNSVSLNQIVVFDNQLSSLKLKTGRIENLSDIQLVISNSNYLFIQNFIFYNIFQQIDQKQMSFIQETTSRFSHPYIRISDIRMIRFEGILIFVKGQSQIKLLIYRIEFTQQLSYFQFLISENYFKRQIVWINNINITWQGLSNWTKPVGYSCLIDGHFDKLRINQVYVNNFCCVIFFISHYSDIVISNLLVNQFRSNNSILLVNDDREHDQQLSIINFTLTNSIFEQFAFLNYKSNFGRLIIQDLIIMDAKLEYFIFANHFNKKSLVLINNIILKNVESNYFLFYSLSSINYQRINLIGGKQFVIFSGHSTNITFQSGLIVDLQEFCQLTRDSFITLDQSEVVNSKIYVPEKKLILLNSQFLGKFSNHESISVYISLDSGRKLFKYKSLSDNVYLVQLPQNNTYLYLPSGRYIENYKYFNYVTGKYDKLYDGISFVNLKEVEEIICITKQVHNEKVIVERNLLLKPGITKLKNIIFTLNPLLKDQFIKYDIICNQSHQLITYRLLVKTLNCQLGEILYKDSCSQCNIDLKMYSVGYNQQYCLQMDQNTMEEIDIGQIKLFKQYWRYSYANKYIEFCKTENCQGGWQPGDKSCQIGYIGALCQECDVYNLRGHGSFGKTSSECSQCNFGYQIFLKGLLLLLIQIGLVYITYYQNQQLMTQYLMWKISKRNFIEILIRQNVNQVTIMLKLLYNYLFTLYLLKDINHFGYIIDLSLNIISNPNFIAVPQFDCLITQIFQFPIQYTQLLLKILIPISIINLIIITYIILIKFKYTKYGINVIIIILVVTNQQNQQVILQRYNYKNIYSLIKLIQKVKFSNIYWTLENLSIQYFSKDHLFYLYRIVLPLAILFLIIISLNYYWIRKVNQRTFNNLKYSIFIFRQYKNQFYFWDQARQIYIWLLMFILYTNDVNYIIFLNIAFIIILHFQEPFQLKNCNKIDLAIYQFSLSTYFSILIEQNNQTIKKFLIISFGNIILLIIYLKYLKHTIGIQYRQYKINFISLLAKLFPYFTKYLRIQTQNKYYYVILKQGIKKSNNTQINKIGRSKYNQNNSFEVEMQLMNIQTLQQS